MPGFGSGPFGRDPFGQWGWARGVLYESIPTVYKQADSNEGNLLQKYSEGQFYSFENLRGHIQNMGSLRDPLNVRSEYSDAEFVVLGKQVQPAGSTEQTGALGVVYSDGTFTAQDRTARFVTTDIGKQLFIRRSNVTANNQQTFTITNVLNATEVYTDPPIKVDAGPMRWELRSQASLPEGEIELELRGGDPSRIELGWVFEDGAKQYDVVSRQMYWQPVTTSRLLNEREASDGYLVRGGSGVPYTLLYSPTYSFQQTDVGKLVCIEGATDGTSDGLWEITSVEPYGPGGEGVAIFGRLTVPGLNNNVSGKTDYVYVSTADRRVSVAHVYEEVANLPLEISYVESDPTRFEVTVRLSTDSSASITTFPSQIGAAIAADPVVSTYIAAGRAFTGGSETPVGAFSPAIVKPSPLKVYPLSASTQQLFWSLRPYARVVLRGPLPLGVIDAEGYDLQIGAAASATETVVTSVTAPFQAEDVGRLLTIRGSTQGNDGTYLISQVFSAGVAWVEAILNPEALDLYWARRTTPILQAAPTRLNPLNYEVTAHAQALLDTLAYDFGIQVDGQQVEDRQRSWVRQVSQWTAIKGTEDSIVAIAHLSGFTANVRSLNAIPALPRMASTAALAGYDFFFIGDGRTGTTGSIATVSGYIEFTDSSVTFAAGDAGKVLVLAGANTAANNNYFVISDYISAHTVRLYADSIGGSLGPITTLSAPDANNGTLSSTLGELYAEMPAKFLSFDDIDVDYLAVACDVAGRYGRTTADRPGIDVPCGVVETVIGNNAVIADAVSTNPGNTYIAGFTSVGNEHTLIVVGDDAGMILGGTWKLTDIAQREYYIDGLPFLLALNAAVPVTYYGIPQTITAMGAGSGGRIRVTAAGHGFSDGQSVLIAGVLYAGVPNPNTTWTLINTTNDTFELVGSVAAGFTYLNFGTASAIETVNTYPNAVYSMTVIASVPPVASFVAFTYVCDLAVGCEFCPTYKIIVELQANGVLGDGVLANDNAFQRCIDALQQAIPAHVEANYYLTEGFSTRAMLTGIISETLVTT